MKRRTLMTSLAVALPLPTWAHHGWSSFDTERPIYLAGTARKVAWRNPHVEFDLALAPDLKLPPDLARRPLPAQAASVDGPRLLAAASLPTRRDAVWHIELAPLSRVNAWKVSELRDGDAVAMLGFTFAGEKGDPVLRVEYLFVGAATYGMRSSPA